MQVKGAAHEIATPEYQFDFPRDYGSHPDFKIEWWYVTGHLKSEGDRRFGYQATFFRLAADSGISREGNPPLPLDIHLAHMALLDLKTKKFYHQERLQQSPWMAFAKEGDMELKNGNWKLRRITDSERPDFELQGSILADISLKMQLSASKPITLFGDNGYSRKGSDPSAASYYMTFSMEGREVVDTINRTLITILIFWVIHQIIEPVSYILSGLDKILTRELIGWIIKSLKILIFILGLAAVLELWGIKIGPIIAGLGLFGVAVALGAQDLFKNLISGILVLVEKRFKIGDWISVEGIIEGIVEKIGFRSTTIRKFDKSLAIIPNFQFAENAVVNVSETSNWLISWIITLQYDTTVDQLKTIRNQIEEHINKSEDFNTSIGIAVRVDKFSDSSIDMYVRCFTNSNSWNDWLSVKEKLAIAIKQIVENNKASFAFPSSSIYIEKK